MKKAVIMTLGVASIIAVIIIGSSGHNSSAFLHEKPWPTNKQLGPETFDVIVDLINETRYHCPAVNAARTNGVGIHGNEIIVHCTTGNFKMTHKPDNQYSVQPYAYFR